MKNRKMRAPFKPKIDLVNNPLKYFEDPATLEIDERGHSVKLESFRNAIFFKGNNT